MTKDTSLRWRWICVGLLQSGVARGVPWRGPPMGMHNWQYPGEVGPVFETFWTATTTTVEGSDQTAPCSDAIMETEAAPATTPNAPPPAAAPPPVTETFYSTATVDTFTTTTVDSYTTVTVGAPSPPATETSPAAPPPPPPEPTSTSASPAPPPPPPPPPSSTTPPPPPPPAPTTSTESSAPVASPPPPPPPPPPASTEPAASTQQASTPAPAAPAASTAQTAAGSTPVAPVAAPSTGTTADTSASNTGGVFAPLPTGTNSLPITTSFSLSVAPTQTASTSVEPTSGSVPSSLETSGRTSVIPFNTTSIPTPASSIIPASTTLQPSLINPTVSQRDNIFVAIATNAPPANIQPQPNHPVPRTGIEDTTTPIETNKFYSNFFLGDQMASTFSHPYSLAWLKGTGVGNSWGIGISHVERSQVVYGPGSPPSYFVNPLGLESVVLSAVELGASTVLTTSDIAGFSVNVNLHPAAGVDTLIQFPIVQGMAFVTGIYAGGTPLIQTSIFFQQLTYIGTVGRYGGTFKYRLLLNDGKNWLMYVTPKGATGTPAFALQDSGHIQGPAGFFGTIQIAKNPSGTNGEGPFDASAGAYATSGYVTAAVDGSSSNYTLAWNKGGVTQNELLMFALPHHLASMNDETSSSLVNINLDTTTKGSAQALLADSMTMVETLPVDMGFAPYHPTSGSLSKRAVSAAAIAAISNAAASELGQDVYGQSVLDSMYFSGKGLAKFATIIYTAHDIAGQPGVAAAGLQKLEAAFATFVNNEQPFPLAYDESWKGAVSSASYVTGDAGADFGNTYYNDHHFHYGYFVYTAAVIAYLNPAWLSQGNNQAWVSMLVRDYANPVSTDPYFPFSRNFDWYHGHSWAKGLYESGDSKDQESSSEDTFSLFAIKMWGKVSGDPNMEARGNLQLAIQARSLQNYFLLEDDNKVQPPAFIPNKVTGILFENKIDHTTYFGTNIEYIEGIHMLPLNPASSLTRKPTFVQQEWDTYFSNGRTDSIDSGWKGVLFANLALTDPVASFQFFSQPGFNSNWLDGGASLTWYLAYSAGLGGA